MPNKPRPDNPVRPVRVENDLWQAAKTTAANQGTTVSAVIREALRGYVAGGAQESLAELLTRHRVKFHGTWAICDCGAWRTTMEESPAGHGGPHCAHLAEVVIEHLRPSLVEQGRRLASWRDDLIASGVDPSELIVPVAPDDTPTTDG